MCAHTEMDTKSSRTNNFVIVCLFICFIYKFSTSSIPRGKVYFKNSLIVLLLNLYFFSSKKKVNFSVVDLFCWYILFYFNALPLYRFTIRKVKSTICVHNVPTSKEERTQQSLISWWLVQRSTLNVSSWLNLPLITT